MNTRPQALITQKELAQRWGKPETSIGWFRAIGVGPRYVKMGGEVMYAVDEIEKYERACLFFDPAEVAFQSIA